MLGRLILWRYATSAALSLGFRSGGKTGLLGNESFRYRYDSLRFFHLFVCFPFPFLDRSLGIVGFTCVAFATSIEELFQLVPTARTCRSAMWTPLIEEHLVPGSLYTPFSDNALTRRALDRLLWRYYSIVRFPMFPNTCHAVGTPRGSIPP